MQLPVHSKQTAPSTWDLASNLDLSGGTLVLGGNPVVLDQVLTDNLTTFKLGEDTTVTRNQGFILGSLDLDNSTLTLGSATTDLTIDIGDSGYWELIAKQADSDHFTDGTHELFDSNAKSTFLENENDPSQSTFMSIGNLDESNYADTDGKYKFKQVWGGKTVDSSGITKEVTWTQTSWLTDSSITGFQEIGTSGHATVSPLGNSFKGLGKSTDGCVIDGNGSSSRWWNCAGSTGIHDGGIPGPEDKIASSMYLYIWESGTNSGSPPGTLATQTADLTVVGGIPSLSSGTTISSTGGTFTFGEGLSISGATVNLQDSTLALGGSFSNTGGTV